MKKLEVNGQSRNRNRFAIGQPELILCEARDARLTGVLHLRTAAGAGRVWFRDGVLFHSEIGRLKGDRALYRVLGYREARYLMESREHDQARTIDFSVDEILAAARARRKEWGRLVERLPPFSAVFAFVQGPDAERAFSRLSAVDRRILARVDGVRPIFAIIDDTDQDSVVVLAALERALSLGLIREIGGDVLTQPSEGTEVFDGLSAPAKDPPRAEAEAKAPDSPDSPVYELQKIRTLAPPQAIVSGPASATRAALDLEEPPSVPPDSPSRRPRSSHPRVGRYEVIGRIGRGGMATVYLCRLTGDGGFSRHFAMKVLRHHLTEDPEAVEMLLREARLTSRLHHPNVVRVFDVGSDRGQPYLVMEYVPGCTVAALMEKSVQGVVDISQRVVASIVIESLAGLFAAHTAADDVGRPLGLVHQDISPENLLLGYDGVARVTDFGVAHLQGARGDTGPGYGKPHYVAPERILEGAVDPRSDIFSMGVVLYRLLTGVFPVDGDSTEEILTNMVTARISPPSHVGRRPHPAFDAVCMKALAPDPSDRYQSAEHFRGDLLKISVVADMLAMSSEVATLVRDATARSGSTGEARVAARPPTFEDGVHPAPRGEPAAPPPAAAIVLARPRPAPPRETVAMGDAARSAEPTRPEPIPIWGVAVFLLVAIGLAVVLDIITGGDSMPDLPTPRAGSEVPDRPLPRTLPKDPIPTAPRPSIPLPESEPPLSSGGRPRPPRRSK